MYLNKTMVKCSFLTERGAPSNNWEYRRISGAILGISGKIKRLKKQFFLSK